MTTKEFSKLIPRSKPHDIAKLCKQGIIPAKKEGKKWEINKEEAVKKLTVEKGIFQCTRTGSRSFDVCSVTRSFGISISRISFSTNAAATQFEDLTNIKA